MKKILFLTNGHGEDLVAAEIIKRLEDPRAASVFPMVGEGKAFEELKVPILGPRKKLPGGGFSLRNLRYLMSDLSSGLIANSWMNLRSLSRLKNQFDLTVAIGDIVPILGALAVKSPFIFIGVNKSDYYKWFGFNYTPWEKWLLKRYARKIYVRDRITMESLNRQGVPAKYVGNPLMDCFEKSKIQNPKSKNNVFIIGLLPGTRDDAGLNLEDFSKVLEELMVLKDPDTEFQFIIATSLPDLPEYMEKKPFSEVLERSDLIIGLSGTGNEQAAGWGKPVVAFYGRGSQYNPKFAQAQKQLLGEALGLVRSRDSRTIATAVWQLLKDPHIREMMAATGIERMGEPGAVDKLAEQITKIA
jgi:hypothetical protein